MDRKLYIAITKSRLRAFSVSVDKDGTVEFSCDLALCTEEGAEVTHVTHSTNSWNDKKLKLDVKIYKLAGKLAGLLHEATEDHVKNLQDLLPAPSESL